MPQPSQPPPPAGAPPTTEPVDQHPGHDVVAGYTRYATRTSCFRRHTIIHPIGLATVVLIAPTFVSPAVVDLDDTDPNLAGRLAHLAGARFPDPDAAAWAVRAALASTTSEPPSPNPLINARFVARNAPIVIGKTTAPSADLTSFTSDDTDATLDAFTFHHTGPLGDITGTISRLWRTAGPDLGLVEFDDPTGRDISVFAPSDDIDAETSAIVRRYALDPTLVTNTGS